MKKICFLVRFLVIGVCFLSCVEEIPVKDLGIKSKLVLHCYISPQYDSISVSLSRSQPAYFSGTTSSKVEYAMVEMSNDNKNWVQIPYSKENNCYLLPQYQFPIEEGKTYYIRASAPDYETVTACCTVPFWRECTLVPEVEFINSKDYRYPFVRLFLSWEDYRGEENQYAFIGSYPYVTEEGDTITMIYVANDEDNKIVFSDIGKDGQKMKNPVGYIDSCTYPMFMEYTEYYRYILFMQTDKNCCSYENSVRPYLYGRRMGDFEDAFLVEPSLVYNNVKNGYGVFGALVFKSYIVDFRKKTVKEENF